LQVDSALPCMAFRFHGAFAGEIFLLAVLIA